MQSLFFSPPLFQVPVNLTLTEISEEMIVSMAQKAGSLKILSDCPREQWPLLNFFSLKDAEPPFLSESDETAKQLCVTLLIKIVIVSKM